MPLTGFELPYMTYMSTFKYISVLKKISEAGMDELPKQRTSSISPRGHGKYPPFYIHRERRNFRKIQLNPPEFLGLLDARTYSSFAYQRKIRRKEDHFTKCGCNISRSLGVSKVHRQSRYCKRNRISHEKKRP